MALNSSFIILTIIHTSVSDNDINPESQTTIHVKTMLHVMQSCIDWLKVCFENLFMGSLLLLFFIFY